jgi:hypothetical protein
MMAGKKGKLLSWHLVPSARVASMVFILICQRYSLILFSDDLNAKSNGLIMGKKLSVFIFN